MKAMILNKYGATDNFEIADIEKPTVDAGYVLIKVHATSVNRVDMMIREMGTDLPFSPNLPAVLGMDFAGVVEKVGEGVSKYNIGDEVYGCAGGLAELQGTLADYMVADVHLIAHKPKNISMREAAALPLVGITAYEGLTRANISKNQKVLVHGGSGGVGHIATQLAKYFGAEVYATVGGDDQQKIIEAYGATAINYKTEKVADYVAKHTHDAGFDVIFDTVGGENLSNSFAAAALNAHISTTVSLLELDLTPVQMKGLSLHVIFMLIPMIHNTKREAHGDILEKLAAIVEQGKLKPLVDNEDFKLQDIGQAHHHLASGQATGKVVVTL